MIIVEELLSKSFAKLPVTGDKKPVYRWGNKDHLIKILEQYQKANQTPYPLIYQVSNRSTQSPKASEVTTNLELVIAVRNIEFDMLNERRWATTYKGLLYPVLENIQTLFTKGNIFLWDSEYTIQEFPNYGNGTEHFTVDHWDAIRFETSITIYGNRCLQQTINF